PVGRDLTRCSAELGYGWHRAALSGPPLAQRLGRLGLLVGQDAGLLAAPGQELWRRHPAGALAQPLPDERAAGDAVLDRQPVVRVEDRAVNPAHRPPPLRSQPRTARTRDRDIPALPAAPRPG